jgi:hypothetical protein
MRVSRQGAASTATALVLNATYEPLCVVPVRRAVVLVLTDKAVSVADGDGFLRSAEAAYVAPAVVRLTRFVRVPYRAQVALTRKAVLCLLRQGSHHDRPRRAAQPRWPAQLGQRGRRL